MMKDGHLGLWLWIVFAGCLFYSHYIDAQPDNRIPFNVGYYIKGVANVDQRDVDAALKIWSHEIGAMYGFDVHVNLYESMNQLVKDFAGNKLDFVSMQTIDYFEYESDFKTKPEMASLKDDRVTIKYFLLVKADGEIKDLAHLRDKRCVMKKDNRLAMMYMDTVLLKAGLPDAEDFFADIRDKVKENQAALSVFFGRADACVISDIGFAMMSELNPQMGRKLKVLVSSDALVDVVAFFHENFPETSKKRAIQGIMQGVKQSKRAAQLKLLLNSAGMAPVTNRQLDGMRALWADYHRLKVK
ncbi:MAG: PhnD/SsuA/transferrin family substrate-binding protein [Deltaproteobacteria bacterium]|nr:PhnD/SsuA/transferrin family substrate-binding protein [Deltaproteobacteria bacterium]